MPAKLEPIEDKSKSAFATGLTSRFIDNLLGFPESVAKADMKMGNFVNEKLAGVLGSGTADFLTGEQREIPDSVLGLPSGVEVLSGMDAGIGVLGGDFDLSQNFDQAMQKRTAEAEAHPIASMLGGFGGDVTSIATLRAPRTGPGGLMDEGIAKLLAAGSAKLGIGAKNTGVAKQVKDVLDNETFQDILRGTGRSLETGVEAAVLSIMQDGDPIETAGLAAGGQLISSLALSSAQGAVELPSKLFTNNKLSPLGKKSLGLAVQGLMLTTLFQVFQSDPDAAAESAFDKLTGALVLGAVAGIGGKRPKDGGLLSNFPTVADLILTVPRTGLIKIAQEMASDPDTQSVVQKLTTDPSSFTESQMKAIEGGLKKGRLVEVIADLKEDDEEFGLLVNPRLEPIND